MKRFLTLLFCIVFFSGCAHLQAILTLKRVSREQKKVSRSVEQKDEQFDALYQTEKQELLKTYPDKFKIVQKFGEPILQKEMNRQGQKIEQWLYRYQTKYFHSPKVYLYFDARGELLDVEYVRPD